jgi:hypothetical protein
MTTDRLVLPESPALQGVSPRCIATTAPASGLLSHRASVFVRGMDVATANA